jgi:hypothetical protein
MVGARLNTTEAKCPACVKIAYLQLKLVKIIQYF